ncbi:TolC family protein [Treponema sp.]|uniref:TolC family protein n=1 Tax=Treponema sp. TaxID=166 RepID=UPI003890B5A7
MKKLIIFLTVSLLASLLFAESVTLTVQDAVEYARKNSRQVKIAAIDIDSKADARNHVLNVFCPNVSFSGTVAKPNEYDTTYATLVNPLYENAGMGSVIPTDYEREEDKYTVVGSASISFSWGLSIIEDVKKANRDYEAGLISWEQVVKQNERDVKKLFYSLLLQQKTIENDQATLENTYQRYLNTKKSYENGNSPRLDMLQSNVTYQNMKRDVEKEELNFKSQLKQFAVILGFSSETELTLNGSLQANLIDLNQDEIFSKYMNSNAEVRLLEKQVESLSAQMRGLNLDSFTPTLSFSYATKQTLNPIDADWFDGSNWSDKGSASMSLTWNFTNALPFSDNRIKYNNLKRQREQMYLKIEQKKQDIANDVQKLFDEITSSVNAIEATKENIELAEEAYRLLSKAYSAGTVDFIEVKDAETQLNKARLAEQTELFTYISSITELEYILDLPEGWNNK